MKETFLIDIFNGLGFGIHGIFGPMITKELNQITNQKYKFRIIEENKQSAKITGNNDKETINIIYEFREDKVITNIKID